MLHQELLLGAVYFGGMLSFFYPCIFAVIPVYLGMLSSGGRRSVGKTLAFFLGLSTSFIILGFVSGSLGMFLKSNLFRVLAGGMIILLGLLQLGYLKIPFLERTKVLQIQEKTQESLVGTFFLGFTFSLGWTPCIGPALASILLISGGGGDPAYGALLMFVYVLGLTTPFVIFAIFFKKIEAKIPKMRNYMEEAKNMGGYLLIFMGILFMTDRFSIFFRA